MSHIIYDIYFEKKESITYNSNEGNRFLQGCYIDYDSTEGKLKHLKRKFNF